MAVGWRSVVAMGSVLALGVAIGAYTQRWTVPSAPPGGEALAQLRLDDLDENVRQLRAAYQRTAAAMDRQSAAIVTAASHPPPSNTGSPEKALHKAEPAVELEAPTAAQIAAADEMATLTTQIINSGQITAADRRAVREAAGDADPGRRDELLLSLVRAVNAQQLKPTEPGPLF